MVFLELRWDSRITTGQLGGFPTGSEVKNPPASAGDSDLINKMNQGAAVGVSPGEQCPQHQEAEREWQAVGQGAYGGRRGTGA